MKPAVDIPALKAERILCFGVLAILFIATLAMLAQNYGIDASSHLSSSYNEGPLLEQAIRLTKGEPIYRSDLSHPPYTINTYGPVYYLLQWPFLLKFGPSLLYGKLISIISHFTTALFAGLIIKRMTQSSYAAAVTGVMVLASPFVGGTVHLYRVDVLAQALSLAGVYFSITAKNRRMDIFSVLCFTAAIYTKQTYALTGPATVFFYHLWQKDWPRALYQAASLAIMTAGVMIAGQWITHGAFFFNLIIANINEYSFSSFLALFLYALLLSNFAVIAIPLLATLKAPIAKARGFSFLYLIFAIIVTAAIGKAGANYGYFSELQIAFSFLIGTLAFACQNLSKRWPVFLVLLTAQTALYLLFSSQSGYYIRLRGCHDDLLTLEEVIKSEPGPVLADDNMGMIVLSGKPLYFEPFEMKQLIHSGHWSQKTFVQELHDGKFPLIVTAADYTNLRWTPEMLEAIAQRYEIAKTFCGNVQLWKPR